MKKFIVVSFVVALMVGGIFAQPPAPQQEHEWLKQLTGEWECECEASLGPGKPPLKSKGTESVRMVGGFWVVAENKGTFFDQPFTGIMTLGFDGQKKKYVGTWIDSMKSHLLRYEGTTDGEGKTLTLLHEGPNPSAPGKRCQFKDVIEIQNKDHKLLTSSMQGEDGKWIAFLTVNSRRKK